jgi:hypothetical protein
VVDKSVFLVKFEKGYYATKQPGYLWSFTTDPMLAKQYSSQKLAVERGKWGVTLITDPCKQYEIEQYVVRTEMIKVG